ncbi:MAG TPA: Gfo/Idh/MocA family oxidoreductase [Micromonosporaceae bacterium]
MRFGVIGTGYWAAQTYCPALLGAADARLECVWGRDPVRTDALARRVGVDACRSYDEMLERVNAVAFAVPPDVQAPLAVRAAAAGRHLLLEKPVATSTALARQVEQQVDSSAVASVVFLTNRFRPERQAWLADAVKRGGWQGGEARWLASALLPGSPYAESTWRQQRGGLWDVGPHALSMLCGALGPVTDVSATAGRNDLTWLLLRHESGATSSAALSLRTPEPAAHTSVTLWGATGLSAMPPEPSPAVDALRHAVGALVQAAETGTPHPCDAAFGRHVTEVLASADAIVAGTG